MPIYTDSYYLVDNRSKSFIFRFIDEYIPNAIETSDEYPVPWFAESPVNIFFNIDDILKYLENNLHSEYAIYWRNPKEDLDIKHFMIFFTDDGKMIFGVSINGEEPNTAVSINVFKELSGFLNTKTGCITVEEPPPTNSIEFIEFCSNRFIPTL